MYITEFQPVPGLTLPPPETVDSFTWHDRAGALKSLTERTPIPRKIDEYVFELSKWLHILESGSWSVDGILSRQTEFMECVACHRTGKDCYGWRCRRAWRDQMTSVYEDSLAIRFVSEDMGAGVFADKKVIPADFSLGEYLGEILPPYAPYEEIADDGYVFGIGAMGYVTAKQYGNWTRFVNHACTNTNLAAYRCMIGRRMVMMFRTTRQIEIGEELLIDYGRDYFEALGIQCKCADFPGDHLPREPTPPDPRADDPVQGYLQANNLPLDPAEHAQRQPATPAAADSSTVGPPAVSRGRVLDIEVSYDGTPLASRRNVQVTGAGGGATIDVDLDLPRTPGGRVTGSASVRSA